MLRDASDRRRLRFSTEEARLGRVFSRTKAQGVVPSPWSPATTAVPKVERMSRLRWPSPSFAVSLRCTQRDPAHA